jgi:hypothetical protein
MAGTLTAVILRLRRRKKAERVPISGLRSGWVEVHGRASGSPGDRQTSKRAPISGRVGIGWRVLVEQEAGVRGWRAVVDLCECVDFELEDETGAIAVRASSSPLTLEVAERRGRGGPFSPPPLSVEELIAETAEPIGVLFHKGFRWREWVLEEGSEITVRGRVISEPGDEVVGYRRLGEVLALAGGGARPLELLE